MVLERGRRRREVELDFVDSQRFNNSFRLFLDSFLPETILSAKKIILQPLDSK